MGSVDCFNSLFLLSTAIKKSLVDCVGSGSGNKNQILFKILPILLLDF